MPVIRTTKALTGGTALQDHQGIATKEEVRKLVEDHNPVVLVDYDVVLLKATCNTETTTPIPPSYQLVDTDDYENEGGCEPLDEFDNFDAAYDNALGGDE